MYTIRLKVFETNSSGTHSFSIGWGIYLEETSESRLDDLFCQLRDEEQITDDEYFKLKFSDNGEYEPNGCLIYLFEISNELLNKGVIPQPTDEDKALIAKINKLLQTYKSEDDEEEREYQPKEPKWHTVEFFSSQ